MPDWSYHTLFRPVLFQLPSAAARNFTLGAMGLLSRIPGGTFVIKTLGHMELAPVLESRIGEVNLKYPIGLSGGLDIYGTAHRALSQFGFGYLEVGPVTTGRIPEQFPILRDEARESLIYPNPYVNEGIERIEHRLRRRPKSALPVMCRLRHMPGSSAEEAWSELNELAERLTGCTSGFFIDFYDGQWDWDCTMSYLSKINERFGGRSDSKPAFLYIPLDLPEDKLNRLCAGIDWSGWTGAVIGDAVSHATGAVIGRDGKTLTLEKIKIIRTYMNDNQIVIAAGGIHEPQDALDVMECGADYVQLHSGLVYAGPGLPKRINEALIYMRIRQNAPPPKPSFWKHWGWMLLLGLGMIVGGILAWLIAATTVLLPYDEAFLGIGRRQLEALNPNIISFMSHDRITLAGTMISIGIMYGLLALFGLRFELHWAKTALMTSGVVGFSSFFLYLGYGYLDPLHAVVAAILLPMFVLSMRGEANSPLRAPHNLHNDRTWKMALWGQLMFVIVGFALAVGGLVISYVGITRVFVPEDLEYLQTSADQLKQLNDKLVPLIAHDRAGFGGALLSDAIAITATALWGIQQGARWIWWMLLCAGIPGFVAGLAVHHSIGYTDFIHLLPVYVAIALYVVGLVLLYPYLMKPRQADRRIDPTP